LDRRQPNVEKVRQKIAALHLNTGTHGPKTGNFLPLRADAKESFREAPGVKASIVWILAANSERIGDARDRLMYRLMKTVNSLIRDLTSRR
jgi:hypothetical protein